MGGRSPTTDTSVFSLGEGRHLKQSRGITTSRLLWFGCFETLGLQVAPNQGAPTRFLLFLVDEPPMTPVAAKRTQRESVGILPAILSARCTSLLVACHFVLGCGE